MEIASHTFIALLHLSTASYNALHALRASQSFEIGSIFPLVTQDNVFPRHDMLGASLKNNSKWRMI